mgnify:CR=1 FL=1
MMPYEFKNPELLWLLVLVPLLGFWLFYKLRRSRPELQFPASDFLSGLAQNNGARLIWLLPALRVTTLALLIIALARPRTSEQNVRSRSERGVDIMMAVDISTSMLARDFKPNRLEATKEVVRQFVKDRRSDRVGLVLYAGESFTKIPLTADQNMLLQSVDEIKSQIIKDGTAIGMGLATAVKRLKKSEAKSKIVILLSDGENNAGNIDPLTAAMLAQEFNIKVYTIGVGSDGMAPMPVARDFNGDLVFRKMQVNIDEELLRQIAAETGGKYFRATNAEKLQKIYEEIDQMEKSNISEIKYTTFDEKFALFALPALLLFGLELLLRYTVLKGIT